MWRGEGHNRNYVQFSSPCLGVMTCSAWSPYLIIHTVCCITCRDLLPPTPPLGQIMNTTSGQKLTASKSVNDSWSERRVRGRSPSEPQISSFPTPSENTQSISVLMAHCCSCVTYNCVIPTATIILGKFFHRVLKLVLILSPCGQTPLLAKSVAPGEKNRKKNG